jgi:hypothetical protein
MEIADLFGCALVAAVVLAILAITVWTFLHWYDGEENWKNDGR